MLTDKISEIEKKYQKLRELELQLSTTTENIEALRCDFLERLLSKDFFGGEQLMKAYGSTCFPLRADLPSSCYNKEGAYYDYSAFDGYLAISFVAYAAPGFLIVMNKRKETAEIYSYRYDVHKGGLSAKFAIDSEGNVTVHPAEHQTDEVSIKKYDIKSLAKAGSPPDMFETFYRSLCTLSEVVIKDIDKKMDQEKAIMDTRDQEGQNLNNVIEKMKTLSGK